MDNKQLSRIKKWLLFFNITFGGILIIEILAIPVIVTTVFLFGMGPWLVPNPKGMLFAVLNSAMTIFILTMIISYPILYYLSIRKSWKHYQEQRPSKAILMAISPIIIILVFLTIFLLAHFFV